jgi:hypothetical protein
LPALSLFFPRIVAGIGVIVIAADIYVRVKKYNRLKENRVEDDFDDHTCNLQPIQVENVKTIE